ncbi:peptidase M48 [Virgisporangium aliadipatigenens]|uniref:Peptidase M48 n=2 Tax=Virgisporangium aliadipatigenens TaxID=741659 RepID=A0A8J3YQW7_9ACTN|nr:peptidase M48 [Virgisporangium aliadipatigenens]
MTTDSEKPVPTRRPIVLTGVSSRAWEHPADRGALTALRELRGFDEVLKVLNGLWNERAWRLEFLGGAIKVSDRQYPKVYQAFASAAATLDIKELPELYVAPDRRLNGMCIGMAKPFIVINHGAVELLDDEELKALLGHELGHLMSGHAVYRTMLTILTGWVISLSWLPMGSFALMAVVAALREWWRKAELSADRAGLLASQDPGASTRLLMKLAGGGDLSQIDTTAFLEQAAEYERSGDLRDSLIKLRMVMGRSHPLPVARAAELRKWIDSGQYGAILGGDYPRREGDRDAKWGDDVKAAAASYRETFANSQDPLINMVRRVGDGAGGVGEWVGAGASRVRDWAKGGPRRDTPPPPGDTPPPSNN